MPAAPTSLKLALSTSVIQDGGAGFVEPGTGYVRQPITLSAPSHTEEFGTVVRNTNSIVFGPAVVAWATVVSVAVLDQDGNIILKGNLAAPKSAPVGDTFSLGVGTAEFNIV